jgi:hypothetical protein
MSSDRQAVVMTTESDEKRLKRLRQRELFDGFAELYDASVGARLEVA